MKSPPLVFPLPGNEAMSSRIAMHSGIEIGRLETRSFPDEESYIRILSDVQGRDAVLLCTLARPDSQFLRLALVAGAARDLGARSVRLVAPYLAYMRQDARFKDGEAVSAALFAKLVSAVFDGVITIDPHLHRARCLDELYDIPTRVVSSAVLIAEWIRSNVKNVFIVGPDAESVQWVAQIAKRAGAPFVVLDKTRLSDDCVEIATPDLAAFRGRQPVIIDDLLSTGRTVIEAARALSAHGFDAPHCVVVHAIFAGDAYEKVLAVSKSVVSTDTIAHASNAISMDRALAEAIVAL